MGLVHRDKAYRKLRLRHRDSTTEVMCPRLVVIIVVKHHHDGLGNYALTMKSVLVRVSICCDESMRPK